MKNNRYNTLNFLIECKAFLSHSPTTYKARKIKYGLGYAKRILKIRTMTRNELVKAISMYKKQVKNAKKMGDEKLIYEWESTLLYAQNRRFLLKGKGAK